MFDWISGEQLPVRSMRRDGRVAPFGQGQPLLNPLDLRIVTDGGASHADRVCSPLLEPLAPFKFITHITKAKAGLPIAAGSPG